MDELKIRLDDARPEVGLALTATVTPGQRFTLLVMALSLDPHEPRAVTRLITYREISEMTGYTITTTMHHIRALIRKGYIHRSYRNGWGATYMIITPLHHVQ